MSKVVCKFCIAYNGLRGSDLKDWPDKDDPDADEWLFNHIESEHHIPVRREGETVEECKARFARQQPNSTDPATCKCPACRAKRAAFAQLGMPS